MKTFLLLITFLSTMTINAQLTFENIKENYQEEITSYDIPRFGLSYSQNLENIVELNELIAQEKFFNNYLSLIQEIDISGLKETQYLDYAVMQYDCRLHLERIAIEKEWKSNTYKVKGTCLFDEELGKKWYQYYLKQWVDLNLTPNEAYHFGLQEIQIVKQKITSLIEEYDGDQLSFLEELNNEKYQLTTQEEIDNKYEEIRKRVRAKASLYFPEMDNIIPVNIRKSSDGSMALAPAFYNSNTFYYNFPEDTYNSREMGYLFMHEAIPGHHYQGRFAALIPSENNIGFWSSGYAEGWAAYIEQYGKELDAYDSIFDEYAQLEWDLIRSVRVAMDVGINYYGWDDDKSMKFWKLHIQNKDEIAEREIERMKRWPAQVITYKYGKKVIDNLKGNRSRPDELKAFHRSILKHGNLPLSVLEDYILKEESKKQTDYNSKLATIDLTIQSLYDAISGEKGEERDWEFLRYMYHPEAKLIFSGKKKDGSYGSKYVTMDEYIQNSGNWMLENGFYEQEMHRITEQFGQIAHVFTTYQCFHTKEDKEPFMRGINSVQLMYNGTRWMVMSIYFTQESKNNPIPEKYLPKQ